MKTIGWFVQNGCELVSPSYAMFPMFQNVYYMSNGDPCRECNCKDTCPAWPRVYTGETKPQTGIQSKPQQRCWQCNSPLNATKVERRGGKCACGASVRVDGR